MKIQCTLFGVTNMIPYVGITRIRLQVEVILLYGSKRFQFPLRLFGASPVFNFLYHNTADYIRQVILYNCL